jgi:hypothetical protein
VGCTHTEVERKRKIGRPGDWFDFRVLLAHDRSLGSELLFESYRTAVLVDWGRVREDGDNQAEPRTGRVTGSSTRSSVGKLTEVPAC